MLVSDRKGETRMAADDGRKTTRIPPALMDTIEHAMAERGLRDFTQANLDALTEWTRRADCAACRRNEHRALRAEAALDRASAELAALRARMAGLAGVTVTVPDYPPGAGKEDRLIAVIQAATPEFPATAGDAAAASGYSAGHVSDIFGFLDGNGYGTRPGKGKFFPAPGADIAGALARFRADRAAAKKQARHAAAASQEAPSGPQAPPAVPAPRKTPGRQPAARTATQEAESAAREEGIPEARTEPRCGKPMRGQKTCGRPAGHNGQHHSVESWQRLMRQAAEDKQEGRHAINTHGHGGYNRGCRCDVCVAAQNEYQRDRYTASPPPVAAEIAKAATVEHLREKAEQIAPGTVMFQEPGAGRRVTHPVPDPVDHTRKQARKPRPEGASEIAAALRNRRNGGQR